MINKKLQRIRRHMRVKKNLKTEGVVKMVIFRSNKYIYGQLVDNMAQKTLVSASDAGSKLTQKLTKSQKAREVGLNLAKKALNKKIGKVVFDRAGYKYHGRIKALAEGAREGGLKF